MDEQAIYDRGRSAVSLRQTVFSLAAKSHPLVTEPSGLFGSSRAVATASIATALSRPWQEIEDSLFNDVKIFQRLRSFDSSVSAHDFLNRYNVAQVQACLYDATSLTIIAETDLKEILRYAKLARLMHSILRRDDGRYQFEIDGPASVHRNTKVYGIRMARMIPGLLSCKNWEMTARFMKDRQPSVFHLNHKTSLRSSVDPAKEFDSDLEADFAAKWGRESRDGWALSRETEILYHGQTVFVPDFALQHEDGRIVHFEIVGFWTPEYLQKKRETLDLFRESHQIV